MYIPKLIDTTLREGEQSAALDLALSDKLQLAMGLAQLGVAIIEVANPAVSPEEQHHAASMLELDLGATRLACHVRCRQGDVHRAIEVGFTTLHFFIPLYSQLLSASLNRGVDAAIDLAVGALETARTLCPEADLRLSIEDAFRAPRENLVHLLENKHLRTLVDRWGIADTVGLAHPMEVWQLATWMRDQGANTLGFHGHNDTGCAVANALMAVDGGARYVDTSILGLGERNGITSLEAFLAAMFVQHGEAASQRWNYAQLPGLAAYVAQLCQQEVPARHCLVGRDAFSHKAGVHLRAMEQEPTAYEAVPPSIVGRKHRLLTNHRLAGNAGRRLRLRSQKPHIPLDERDLTGGTVLCCPSTPARGSRRTLWLKASPSRSSLGRHDGDDVDRVPA